MEKHAVVAFLEAAPETSQLAVDRGPLGVPLQIVLGVPITLVTAIWPAVRNT